MCAWEVPHDELARPESVVRYRGVHSVRRIRKRCNWVYARSYGTLISPALLQLDAVGTAYHAVRYAYLATVHGSKRHAESGWWRLSTLDVVLAEEIAREGPIPFARFMEVALYFPSLGYYSGGGHGREPLGWEGDYFTSGDVTPLWGWSIARQLHQMWELLDRPARFDVVEPGAGRGQLARETWRYALARAPEWAASLRYTLVDRAPADSPLRQQRERWLNSQLAAFEAPEATVRWAGALSEAAPGGPITGCVVSNELVDALPVHILQVEGGALREVYVDVEPASGRLIEVLGAPSSPELAAYLDTFAIPWQRYPDGWRAEVCLEALTWMRSVAEVLGRGFALTIDYGDSARRLYTPERRQGTLAAYARHTFGASPLAQPGQQDLTAHVNFSALVEAGRSAGLRVVGMTTQELFLRRLGIVEEMESLAARLFPAADTERHTERGQADYLRRSSLRNAVSTVLNPRGLGGFHVLAQQKDVPGARLLGLPATQSETPECQPAT